MCGRFTVDMDDPGYIEEFYGADLSDVRESFQPNYNVAPTHEVLTLRQTKELRVGHYLKWGLKPVWAKKLLINAQAEGLFEKRTWAKAARERRCLIPADSFIEFRKDDGPKKPPTPYRFSIKDHPGSGFAGIWLDHADEPDEPKTPRCIIVTTRPNELVAPFHDRMPVFMTDPQDIEA